MLKMSLFTFENNDDNDASDNDFSNNTAGLLFYLEFDEYNHVSNSVNNYYNIPIDNLDNDNNPKYDTSISKR